MINNFVPLILLALALASLHDSPVVNKIMKDLAKECADIINSTTADPHYKTCEKGIILQDILCRYDYFAECDKKNPVLKDWSPVG